MRRCLGVTAFRQQFAEKGHRWKVRGCNCLDLVTIGHKHSHRPGEVQRNGPPHYGAWGAMGELQMNSKLTKLAAVGVLSLCTAAPALAGSVTQPGETVGLNTGAPLPQGWYAINTVDWGCNHHSGRRLVNAVDDFGRETTVRGGVARGG